MIGYLKGIIVSLWELFALCRVLGFRCEVGLQRLAFGLFGINSLYN